MGEFGAPRPACPRASWLSPASRGFASDTGGGHDVETELRLLGDTFGEARLCVEDAMDSFGTTYFSEDAEDARLKTKEALDKYSEILGSVDEGKRKEIQLLWGLKLEQLKGELQQVEEKALEDD